MKKAQQNKFDLLYQKHVNALKRQGKSEKTVDAYARAVRRIADYFDRCPDKLKTATDRHRAKIVMDRGGLQKSFKAIVLNGGRLEHKHHQAIAAT